jgi:hypothetical protein
MGIVFCLLTRDVVIAFVIANTTILRINADISYIDKFYLWNGMVLNYCGSNVLGCFWQIKSNTYAGFFGFVGFKNGFIR